ncbi:sulfatase-like hydrolase/transferase [Haloferula chungangensis]|uniref:Sulfatase-like hydrolase/transferase n=1 Tax=Haloferula chungangensis TaxID=1048331 RepID=A0ABW2L9A3_9BACT
MLEKSMNLVRRTGLSAAALFLTALSPSGAAERPNILWLSAEDISPNFGCYGDPHAITPQVDALADEGMRFSHAFTSAGVCAPCRSSIITGMYQNAIGTHHMRCNATMPDWLKPFPLYLREAGYYCTNNSKTDYQFRKPSAATIWNESSSKADWKNRPDGSPFFAVYNFNGCHETGIESKEKYENVSAVLKDSERQDADKLTTLPPYYPDTPVVREDWKRNYELITALDHWVGEHIQKLKDSGLYEDTIIMFWSDHGVGLPRAKRWLYDSGTRIPLVVRIPEKFRVGEQGTPGSVNDALINSTDFGPTVMNLAGLPTPAHMHGQAILGEGLPAAREYVYGARDRMDERYDIIRAVRDKRYRYIRNFEATKPYYQYMNTPEKGATMREIRRLQKTGQLPEAAALFTAAHKPAEELYDLQTDPHEIHNLAEDPKFRAIKARMLEALTAWQRKIGDMGLIPESELERLVKTRGSTYEVLSREAEVLEEMTRAAVLASTGPEAFPELIQLVDSSNPTVRYWVSTGIGNFATEAGKAEQQILGKAVEDEVPAVKIAAARALCRSGKPETGLPVLIDELSSDNQWARLEAAIVLDELDETARPALPALQAALKNQPNKYIVRVANKAVNDLLGTQAVVE